MRKKYFHFAATFIAIFKSKIVKRQANVNQLFKEDAMIGILVPITLFILTAIVLWKFFDSRHIERKAIIEKGLNPSDYMELYKRQAFATNPLSSLKWGLLAIFAGLGTLTAMVLDSWYHSEEIIYPGVILIFGGIGLVVYYTIASKKIKEP